MEWVRYVSAILHNMHTRRTLAVAGRKEKQGKNVIYYTPNICNFQGTAQCNAQCLDLTCKRTKGAFLQRVQEGHFWRAMAASSLIIYLHWVGLGLKSTRGTVFTALLCKKKKKGKTTNYLLFLTDTHTPKTYFFLTFTKGFSSGFHWASKFAQPNLSSIVAAPGWSLFIEGDLVRQSGQRALRNWQSWVCTTVRYNQPV